MSKERLNMSRAEQTVYGGRGYGKTMSYAVKMVHEEADETKTMIDLACGGDPLPPIPEGPSRRSDMRKFKKEKADEKQR